jgi:hypothetical protein
MNPSQCGNGIPRPFFAEYHWLVIKEMFLPANQDAILNQNEKPKICWKHQDTADKKKLMETGKKEEMATFEPDQSPSIKTGKDSQQGPKK